jgi:hypothetical protein
MIQIAIEYKRADMTQSLLSHGGIRTLPGARVQGESVSTMYGGPRIYDVPKGTHKRVLPRATAGSLPTQELPTPSLTVPVARSFSAMGMAAPLRGGCTWMLSLARTQPYCSSDSLRRGLEPKCNWVPFKVSYQLIQELGSMASAQPRASGK